MTRCVGPLRILPAALLLASTLLLPAARAQELPRLDNWVEARSPHFIVVSDAGEKKARQMAAQFERIREVYRQALPSVRVDTPAPLVIFAARNEKSFRQLLPAYWEQSDRRLARPLGMFIHGPEKNYVAVRTDATGENPYHTVYHEYFHLVTRLSFPPLPLWMSEGLAEFWSRVRFFGKEVRLGGISDVHLQNLRRYGAIPLPELLAADHHSPHYKEREKTSVFYAQSWALVHFLMVGDEKASRRRQLNQLLALLARDVPPEQAQRRALGDYAELERQLQSYLRQDWFYELKLPAPPPVEEKSYPVRPLPPAQVAALHADFHVHMNRPIEARRLLEEALRLEPGLAMAYEALGYLNYRQNKQEEALKAFARAAELDSRSFLAHYYGALLRFRDIVEEKDFPEIERALERAIELNPSFAPAYSTLASCYARRPERAEQALSLARKAVQLEPGEVSHQFNLAMVLLQAEKLDEARRIAARVAAAAKNDEQVALARQLDVHIRQMEESLALRQRVEAEAARALQRRPAASHAEPAASAPVQESQSEKDDSEQHTAAERWAGKQRVRAEGRIGELSCSGDTLKLTLDFGGLTLKLQASDYEAVEYLTTQWQPPPNFLPCTHLKDRRAAVVYVVAQEKPFVGEILSIEVLK